MGLPVGSSAVTVKKDIATVTSPVEIKQIKIGDPKLRAKLCFEVVTARVIESAGKKHVVRNIIHNKFQLEKNRQILFTLQFDECFTTMFSQYFLKKISGLHSHYEAKRSRCSSS